MAKKIKTIEEAVKAKCLDCSNGMKEEVLLCNIKDCPLWNFRNGLKSKPVIDKQVKISKLSKKLLEEDIEIED